MLELAGQGARVMHRGRQFGAKYNLPIRVLFDFQSARAP